MKKLKIKFCTKCGKKLVEVDKEFYFDKYTGKKKMYYKLQCPEFVSYENCSAISGTNGHDRWFPLEDVKGIWAKL